MTQVNAMMQGNTMMQGYATGHACPMMGAAGGTFMMLTMGIVWLLTVVVLLLGIAALVKYLRSGPPRG
jgi:uncharacterized membrane protein